MVRYLEAIEFRVGGCHLKVGKIQEHSWHVRDVIDGKLVSRRCSVSTCLDENGSSYVASTSKESFPQIRRSLVVIIRPMI